MSSLPLPNGALPLVVDLDGTLTATDTLFESVLKLIKQEPLTLLLLPVWLLLGRATLKCRIAERVELSVATLPYRQPLLAYLREQKAAGRKLVLATAAHQKIANAVAGQLGIFDQVIATTAERNLKGANKLEVIRKTVGEHFTYAGDSAADLKIWAHSDTAILVGAVHRYRKVQASTVIEKEFPVHRAGLLTWVRALRVHQWMKNLLLLVPLLTSFGFLDGEKVFSALAGFLAFCLAASATYIVNDLWDLDNDRGHPKKFARPLASAEISIPAALAVAGIGLAAALLIAASVSIQFVVALLAYLVITSAYSWVLKRVMLVDVLVLASLYTLRILAGSVAIGVVTSSWLLVFSIFIFFSLALVKRCSELVSLHAISAATSRGRDYRVTDLAVLWPLGIGAGLCSVIVFGLFVTTLEAQQRYATPELMWLAGLGLLYWISRLWIKTNRGEMHDDPLVFALKDRSSRLAVLGMVAVTLAAYFIELDLS